ncbi:hypothetical protein LZC95_50260 [Pendulispora brunnea]|uniref:Uncharacterized protein n=1 Tax=Pendulispora brunnea TaxID=2905690 RepID=A0ABZ2K7C7_9BACT
MALESESWLRTIFRFLAFARYQASPPTLADNDVGEVQCDSRGALHVRVVAEGPETGATRSKWSDALRYEARRVVTTFPAKLHMLLGFNAGAATRFVLVFDTFVEPVADTIPKFAFPVESGQPFSLTLPRGREFGLGIFVAASTSGDKYTPDAGAQFHFVAEYT